MITTYSGLLPFLMPEVKGCSENIALQALRRSAREFASVTEMWQKELTAINLVASTAQYALDPDENPTAPDVEPEIRRIVWLKIDDAEQSSDTYELTVNTLLTPTTAFSVTFLPDYVPTSSSTGGLKVKVVLIPDWNSDYLPTFYRTRWGEALVSGALANLLRMPSAPWGRPDRGQLKLEEYQGLVSTAVKERYIGRVGGTLRMVSPVAFDI